MVKGRPIEGSGFRVTLAVVGVIALAGLAAAPFLGRVEQTGEPPHRMRVTETSESTAPQIDGSMTLKEVVQMTGVPTAVILRELGLPPKFASLGNGPALTMASADSCPVTRHVAMRGATFRDRKRQAG